MPDNTIFETVEFSYEILANRFRELSFLNPKLKIKLLRSSHSIINFIKTGKPLYINNAIHTNKEIKGTMTDIPLKFKIFREVVCF